MPERYAKDNRTAQLTARSDKSVAYVTNNKRLYSAFVLLKRTTDRHEASRGLFATAELFVFADSGGCRAYNDGRNCYSYQHGRQRRLVYRRLQKRVAASSYQWQGGPVETSLDVENDYVELGWSRNFSLMWRFY